MKTLFFGTSEFAVPILRVLATTTQVVGVVTQPDRPAGRGQRLQSVPAKRVAQELGLPVYEPAKLRAFTTELADNSYDCFVLASYGKILPQALLDMPRFGALNVHPSLLPKYRGATPIQGALANGDRETGVTIMLMDAGLDTGDIVVQKPFPIVPEDNYGVLHDKLADFSAQLLSEALALFSNGFPHFAQQGEATVTRPIRKEDLTIDWSWDAARIVNHVRAYALQPAARAMLNNEAVKILRAHIGNDGALCHAAGDGQYVTIDELIAPNRGKETGNTYAARHQT